MEPKNLKPSLPTPIPQSYPSTPFSGFKFSTIGQGPSLLQRMSDSSGVPHRPPQSDQHPSQEQHNTSHTRLRPTLLQPLQIGASSVEPGQSVDHIPTQRGNSLVPAPTSLQPSDPQNDVKPVQPLDQIRVSVLPDLHYPGVTPDIESPVSWESQIALPQPAPMDQGASRSQLPDPRNLPPVPVTSGTGVGASVVDGATSSSAHSLPPASLQTSGATTPIEPEQVRRPVEHLFRLASVREESMSKRRETFDLRSGELSNFCAEAVRAAQDLQDKIESFKQLGEETRAQAEQTLQEANKMRDLADRLILSAGTLGEDMLGAKNHVGRAVERSEQMTRFVRKSFDWLATLRAREQEKIALVQAEIAEQELAEVVRRQQELQNQLERRKIEEQQKKEAAQREEAEREASRKKKEEESEAARKKSYEMRRAEVLADKWRAHAQSIQAERERKTTDAPGSNSTPSAGGSHPLLSASITPTSNSQPTHGAGISTSVTSSQVAVPAPSRSPVSRTGEVSDIVPPSHSLPSSNKVKAVPALVSFVPAQTEAGRAVNTDSPLSSTTLASELHMRNNVEASQHPRFNQATRDPVQEQVQSQMPGQAAPTVASHRVGVKREPSAEALPSTRVQPSPDTANTDQSRHRQRVVSFSTASHDGNMDQQLPTFESHATSLHVAQTEDHDRRGDPSGRSPMDPESRPRHFIHDRVPTDDSRVYKRQGSISSDRSLPRWNDRRSSSPPSSGGRRSRSLSRSPPYLRKRMRSRTPYEARPVIDRWPPERPRVRARVEDDRDRSHRYNGYDRGRRGDSPRRYRRPPPRRNVYRPSHSPPPSPRHFRNERSPPGRSYRDRTPTIQHVPLPLREAEWRPAEYRPSTNARHYESTYGVDARRITEMEEQPRRQQHERQRHSPSPSEHDQKPTSSSRQEEVDIGLLDRINMEEADNRGGGRGRPPPDTMRGGPNPRRGMRGASSSGRGRGDGPGPKPALLSRMTETASRPARAAHAPSLSDRMQD